MIGPKKNEPIKEEGQIIWLKGPDITFIRCALFSRLMKSLKSCFRGITAASPGGGWIDVSAKVIILNNAHINKSYTETN